MDMRAVYSSHIERIGYDEDLKRLVIEYKNGRMAAYEGVPPDVAARVAGAPSIGEALWSEVRGRFGHKYL